MEIVRLIVTKWRESPDGSAAVSITSVPSSLFPARIAYPFVRISPFGAPWALSQPAFRTPNSSTFSSSAFPPRCRGVSRFGEILDESGRRRRNVFRDFPRTALSTSRPQLYGTHRKQRRQKR